MKLNALKSTDTRLLGYNLWIQLNLQMGVEPQLKTTVAFSKLKRQIQDAKPIFK